MAFHQGEAVAGAVFFKFNEVVYYKYGASDMAFQHLRPNNLIMWNAIKRSLQQGFRYFHFGRTDPGNEGLLQFKRGWGVDESDLCYFEYSLKEKRFITKNAKLKSSYGVFSKMPLPLLKLSGRILYRYVG